MSPDVKGDITECCGRESVVKGGVLGFEFGCLRTRFSRSTPPWLRDINSTLSLPVATSRDVLTDILRDGAERLLAQAVEAEVAHADRLARGPERETRTAMVEVSSQWPSAEADDYRGRRPNRACQQPRVLDRRAADEAEPFSSQDSSSSTCEKPRAWRSTKSLEELIPWLYLKGVSTGDIQRSPGSTGGSELPPACRPQEQSHD